jgi:anaerobic selenocysteine-containing dehydrogenase
MELEGPNGADYMGSSAMDLNSGSVVNGMTSPSNNGLNNNEAKRVKLDKQVIINSYHIKALFCYGSNIVLRAYQRFMHSTQIIES